MMNRLDEGVVDLLSRGTIEIVYLIGTKMKPIDQKVGMTFSAYCQFQTKNKTQAYHK